MSGRSFSKEQSISFYRHQLLDVLTQRIPRQEPDWKSVADQFRNSLLGRERNYSGHVLAARFSELAIRKSLMSFQREYPVEVKYKPIPQGSFTRHFHFSYRDGELYVRRANYRREGSPLIGDWPLTGIDALIAINQCPVVFECKAVGLRSKHHVTREVLEPRCVRKKLTPVREYFQEQGKTSECGYALVVFPELANLDEFTTFKERGGVVIPFWMKRDVFRQSIYDAAKEYDLWIPRLDGDQYFERCRK